MRSTPVIDASHDRGGPIRQRGSCPSWHGIDTKDGDDVARAPGVPSHVRPDHRVSQYPAEASTAIERRLATRRGIPMMDGGHTYAGPGQDLPGRRLICRRCAATRQRSRVPPRRPRPQRFATRFRDQRQPVVKVLSTDPRDPRGQRWSGRAQDGPRWRGRTEVAGPRTRRPV